MGAKGRVCMGLLLVLVFLVVGSLGVSEVNPEVKVCKMMCEQIRSGEQDMKPRCVQKCEEYYEEKLKKEKGGRGDQYNIIYADKDEKKMIEDCHQTCQGSQGEQQRPQCFKTCMQQQRSQEQGKSQRGDTSWPGRSQRGDTSWPGRSQHGGTSRTERTRKPGKQQTNNPYVFQDQHFTARLESDLGNVRVLQKFTDRSDLFRGIEKYRVAFLEAEPQTFIAPNHWDADALVFVANGRGTITLVEGDSRQSHNIKRGDLFRVPAGISAYLINRDNNERLVLAKVLRSISVPGELEIFSVGTGNAESSFYNAFSTEVLEAAFNIDRESIEKIIGQQQGEQGIFKKATEEQIKALSGKDKEESGIWPFSGKSEQGTFNIFKNDPSVANENGILHEVDSNDFPDLRADNIVFSFFNITQGSMAGPFYNTKATLVLMVPNGQGRFEMACPHLSEQQSQQIRGSFEINPQYEKVSSELRRGTVVVIPAGHPVVIEATGDENLEVIGFGLHSDKNEWFPLAGRENVMSQWEDEAIELTFGLPAREVQKVIEKQSQKLFFKGPARTGRAFA